MITSGKFRLLFAACALQLTASACSTPQRLSAVPESASATSLQPPIRYLVTRETTSFAAEAARSVEKEKAYLSKNGGSQPLPPAYYLAISGGGDDGAFGAGFLNGWTAAGTRPQFKVVTGVSTGALIAPFAFLGPRYDAALKHVFTTSSQKEIFRPRGMIKGVFGDALADTRPLAGMIASFVTPQLLQEIAAEYAKGRVLLVGTTNLDTLEPVIWNVTAIAADQDPRSLQLVRDILLASASIPAAFPPVMIDVDVQGTPHQEMHVDGGAVAQVFFYPPSAELTQPGDAERKRVLFIIRNARMDAERVSVERRTLAIAGRAIASLTRSQGIGDLYRVYTTAQRDGIDFNLAYIPASFDAPRTQNFDTHYMNALYKSGEQLARSGYQWEKYPPGYAPAQRSPERNEGPASVP